MSELEEHEKDAFINSTADYWSVAESVSTTASVSDSGTGISGSLGSFSEGDVGDVVVGGEVNLTRRQASDLSSEGTDDNEVDDDDNEAEDDAPPASFNE